MQTPKGRSGSSGALPKVSPRSISSEASPKNSPKTASPSEGSQKASPRVARQLKTGPRYSEHTASSSNLANRPKKERSPKVADRPAPRSPASAEKKTPARVSDLESQILELENDLKTVKDQLCSAEAVKKQAQKEAEESKEQLAALSLKLEESQKQLSEQAAAPEDVIGDTSGQPLQTELEAVQKKHSHDSAALASALDEINQLKAQLNSVAECDTSHLKQADSEQSEIHKVKESLSDALSLVEEMKNQLKESKESETRAQAVIGETLMQLETAKKMVETLKTDGLKATEEYNSVAAELEQSRARVVFLEELVNKLKAECAAMNQGDEEIVKTEDISVKKEVEQLKSALESAEIRYSEEQERTTVKIKDAFEMVEKIKSESSQREEELVAEIKKSKYEIEELKANLMDKETELQGICEENEGLTVKLESSLSGQRDNELEKELHKAKVEIENMKSSLMEKEKMWQNITEENEKLKLEMKEMNKARLGEEAVSEIEAATAAEKEALMKVGYMAEELDKSNKKAARIAEQLEAAQATNAGMEAELRKLKVQSDQWRKAAEAAASMLNNGQLMERTGSMDSHYSPRGGKISSPYTDDLDDDILKKKNANMLRRIGVLWKKPQK